MGGRGSEQTLIRSSTIIIHDKGHSKDFEHHGKNADNEIPSPVSKFIMYEDASPPSIEC